MAGRTHVEGSRGRAWRSGPAGSQRQRLLGAIGHLAATEGYSGVTVGRITAAAGVSRPTFYEHFGDRERCFAAALAPIAQQLLGGMREAVARERPQHALLAATRALLSYACSQPAHARMLLSDTLGGGEELREVRDRLIDDAARFVEQAHAQLPADAMAPALPAGLALGVVCRMLASRMSVVAQCPNDLAEELPAWISAYEQPVARDCWRSLTALGPAARSPFVPMPLCAPPAPRPGRPRASEGALAENVWLRIVFATAEIIRRDGNASATVAEIASAAGVDPRAFYRLFASKQHALDAAGELLFRHAIAAAAGGFVAGDTWPERVWEAARALMQYADENPTLTYIALVESFVGEAGAGQRGQERAQAFAVFLREGDPDPGGSSGTSELVLEAISMCVFELCYRHLREDGATALSSLLGRIVFISLAPFLGALQASDFVRGRLSDDRWRAGLASAA